MGCVYSKRFVRTTSFHENLKRPFPPVTAIPILDDLVLANSHEFVALICKANKLAKKLPAPSEPENVLPFMRKDSEGERLMSGNHVRMNSDLQSESSLKEEKSEKYEVAEGEPEEHKPTEKDRTEIINTWELMEGLDDGETYHVSQKIERDSDSLSANSSDIREELIYKSALARISRSNSPDNFHTVEEYDAFLARRKRPLWDRNSKRYLYYLGHEHTETINEFSSSSLFRLYSCPPLSLSERNMTPVVIDWKEDSEDDDDFSFEFAVLQPSFEVSDTKNDVNSYKYIPQTASENNSSAENDAITQTASENNSSKENIGIAQTVSENNSGEENNGIAQTISENSGSQENSHSVEMNIGNTDMAEGNLEEVQSTESNSGKKRMHVRAKLNDLGGVIIPSTPEFSAVGSLKEWLTSGGNLYSPGVSTGLPFGYSEFGDKWSKINGAGNSGQPSSDGAKMETDYSPVLNNDDKLANDAESSVCSDSGVSAIENKQWDCPLFDPELLASFEKALEQLSEEEQYLLRQIDEDSSLLCMKSCAKDNEDDLQDSSRTEDTQRQSTHLSNDGEYSTQDPRILENFCQQFCDTPRV